MCVISEIKQAIKKYNSLLLERNEPAKDQSLMLPSPPPVAIFFDDSFTAKLQMFLPEKNLIMITSRPFVK